MTSANGPESNADGLPQHPEGDPTPDKMTEFVEALSDLELYAGQAYDGGHYTDYKLLMSVVTLAKEFVDDYNVAWTLVEFLQNGLRDQQTKDREAVSDIITPKLIIP